MTPTPVPPTAIAASASSETHDPVVQELVVRLEEKADRLHADSKVVALEAVAGVYDVISDSTLSLIL